MSTISNIILFVIVLLCYIHITEQHKKSEDLEIYEMDYNSNPELQEVCNLKQPITFVYENIDDSLINLFINNEYFKQINELKVKNSNDYWSETDSVDFIILPTETALSLFNTDSESQYFTEGNHNLINDSNIVSFYEENDILLQPTMTSYKSYDVMFGSNGSVTPMKYHTNYRYFIYCTKGSVKVKLTPWRSKRFLHPKHDYEEYEFKSSINVWNPQPEYKEDFNKIKFVEFELHKGTMLYIPPFWWHSFKFNENACLCNFTYNSIANCLYNIPNWALYFIQQSNIRKAITKTHNIETKTQNNNDKTDL